MNISFFNGNIVDANVDAIVLPANPELKEGTGASEAIFSAAGRKYLTKACKRIGHCEIGMSVPTLGYDLEADYILHTVVPVWIDGNHDEYNLLSTAYASALELADVMECTSVAFPLLAAGNNGYDINLAFEIAVKSIEKFECSHLQEAVIVLFDQRVVELAKQNGYKVTLLPRNLKEDLEELEKRKARKKMMDKAKDVAEEQLMKGIEWLREEENRKKLIEFGISVFQTVKVLR